MSRAHGFVTYAWGIDLDGEDEVVFGRRRTAWGPRRGGGPWGPRRRLRPPRAARHRDMRPAAARWTAASPSYFPSNRYHRRKPR